MAMNPNAFYCFKNNSDISRTLIQSNLKPKTQLGIQKRCQIVIKVQEIDEQNTKTLTRLQQELKVLKPINKPSYNMGKRNVTHILKL